MYEQVNAKYCAMNRTNVRTKVFSKAVFSLLTFLILITVACDRDEIKEKNTIPVTIEVVTNEQIRRMVYASARLEGVEDATLTSITNSEIEELHVSEGDTVCEGTLLITLETDEMQKALVQKAGAALITAQVSREISVNNYNRAVSIFEEGGMAQQALDDAITSMDAAEAEVEIALAEYNRTVSEEDSRCITAPFDGSIVRIWACKGDIAAGPLLSISNSESVTAEVFLSEKHLQFIRPGLTAQFQPVMLPDSVFEGIVYSSTSTIDQTSGLISARIRIPNPGAALRTGMTGTVSIVLDERDSVPVVRESVLRRTRDGWEISVVRNGIASVRTVEIGISSNGMYEIRSGLHPGDSVIVLGHDIVADGDSVLVVGKP